LERPAVFAGALRDPNESGALSVTLSVWSDQIVMHNDDVELGEWARDSVRIIPLDSSSYEFVAEGDRLIFIPDDRTAFDSIATPSAPAAPQASEKRKKSKSSSSSAKKTSRSTVARVASATGVAASSKKAKKSKTTKSSRTKPAAAATAGVATASATSRGSQSKTKKPKRIRTRAARASEAATTPADGPTRSWRRQKAKPAAQASAMADSDRAASTPTGQPVVSSDTSLEGAVATATKRKSEHRSDVETDRDAEAPQKRRRSLKARRLKVPSRTAREQTPAPAAVAGRATTTGSVKPKRWVRLIDSIRVYAVFGLDRVPVDTSLRGSEHQHTWDHRAAASSGPSKHICTICGRLKL